MQDIASLVADIEDNWDEPEPARVPEPASLAMIGMGLVGLVAVRRRRTS